MTKANAWKALREMRAVFREWFGDIGERDVQPDEDDAADENSYDEWMRFWDDCPTLRREIERAIRRRIQ